MNLLLHFQNIFTVLPDEPQRMEKCKQCWPGKVNQLNGNKLFFPLNFFSARKNVLRNIVADLPADFQRSFTVLLLELLNDLGNQ